jgi:hypothetical protein
VTYTRNGGKWRYENIDAEDVEQAKEEVNRRVKETFNQVSKSIFKVDVLTEEEKEKEIAKFKIVTVSKFI